MAAALCDMADGAIVSGVSEGGEAIFYQLSDRFYKPFCCGHLLVLNGMNYDFKANGILYVRFFERLK
ncbi:hypothetical protein ACFQNF_17075 [Iodobacter arcticus]|uniref:Uncharacterized protein n=1 Tax=Iodobacter arcticus TaxID=590593 RepID=A0ABW2R0X2_9NEIS